MLMKTTCSLLKMATCDMLFSRMKRREYSVSIMVNRVQTNKVIVDPHYEEKHAESISDEFILELVKTLDG